MSGVLTREELHNGVAQPEEEESMALGGGGMALGAQIMASGWEAEGLSETEGGALSRVLTLLPAPLRSSTCTA